MAAFVVVELSVKNAEAKKRYSEAAGPVLSKFNGELVVGGAWTILFGEPAFSNGVIMRFPDRETALAWYNSPEYQKTIPDRTEGITCRFSLIG